MSSAVLEPARILVVDDDRRNLLVATVVLDRQADEIVLAASGHEALERLRQQEFAVVVLDVRMPGLDGLDTGRLIRAGERNRRTPIIFVTAHDPEPDQVRRAYLLGAVDFLQKPIVPEVLRAKVAVFVELHRRAERNRWLERRAYERQLVEARDRWDAEALRLESARKDQFLATLAHELRNPLAALVLGLHLLRRQSAPSRYLAAMDRQLGQVTRLVDDLLDISRIRSGKVELRPRPIDLGTEVHLAVETASAGLAERSVTVVDPPAPVQLVADPDRLGQVLTNLLTNASRHTAPDGVIRVGYGVDRGECWVRVEDDGDGIDPAVLARIFEPFVQGCSSGPGLGLGLTIVRTLVELHHGTVAAASDGPGRGAAFEVRLPLRAPEPREPVVVRGPRPGRVRVLVVDEDVDIRSLTAEVLRLDGHVVDEAGNGTEAVARARQVRPDVILLDLAAQSGDYAAQLRSELGAETPPLVAISGYSASADDRFAAQLMKPVDPAQLVRVLAELTN